MACALPLCHCARRISKQKITRSVVKAQALCRVVTSISFVALMEQQADADESDGDEMQPLVPDEEDCDGDVGETVSGDAAVAASAAGRMRSDRDFCDPEYCPSDSDDDADQRFDRHWGKGADPESLFGGIGDSVFDDPVVPTPTQNGSAAATTTLQTIANDGRGLRCAFVCVVGRCLVVLR